MPVRTLTKSQADFVKHFMDNGGNATAAYLSAYPKCNSRDSARNKGAALKRHPVIAQAIGKAERAPLLAVEKAIERYGITQDRLAEAMARLAFTELRQVVSWSTVVGEDGRRRQVLELHDSAAIDADAHQAIVEVSKSAAGEVRVKLADKRAAMMDLARLKGWIIDKQESKGDPSQLVMLKIER